MEDSRDENDEASLIEDAARGNPQAFESLFNRHYPMIHAFAYRLCLDRTEAQDVAQETFVKAVRALGTFRGGSFKHWLFRIVVNASRDSHRARERRTRLHEALSENVATHAEHDSAAHSAVRDALATLPPDLRQTVALVFYEGLNHAEAAEVLECAETTVSWRIFRAKRKLKKILEAGQ